MLEILMTLVAIILLIVPPLDWIVVFILLRVNRETNWANMALGERFKVALLLALATTVNGVLASARILGIYLSTPLVVILLSTSFILISIPNVYWLLLFMRHRFRKM